MNGDTKEISEHRRLEEALRAAEERFRTLVQFSFDVYWETDARHRFVRQDFANALADAPRAGSEIGKTRWEVPYLEPDEEAWRKHRAMLDAHVPFRDFELARPTPGGGRRYVSVSGFPTFDGAGRFTGYRGVGRHVTERKRAEAEHRAYVRLLESMDRIDGAMRRSNDLEQTVSDALDTVLDIFDCDRAWLIHPCDPQAQSWSAVMERTRRGSAPAFAGQENLPMDAAMADVFAAARAAGGVVLLLPSPLAERFAIGAQMAIALHPKGDTPYLFGVHQSSHARSWTDDEQRLFEAIGSRLADALTTLLMFRNLRESERRVEAAQRIAHVGWWERDFITSRVSLSDESCRIFGVQPVELPHWHGRWLSLIHREDSARAAAASDAALGGGPRYDIEYRVVRPDGTVRVVHSQGDVTWDESGRPVRQFGVMQDITELRRAEDELRASEAALRESEERYRTLFEKANDAILLENEHDEIVEANERACTLLGYSRDELLRMRVPDLQAPEVRGEVGRVIHGEIEKYGNATFESVDLHRSGRRIPVEVTNTGISDRGENLVLSVVRDITQRKRVEAELRTRQELLDLAQKAARAVAFDWYIGARESENRWSPELEAMYGVEPGTFDGTYKGWRKLIHSDDWPAVKAALGRAHESGDVAAEYRIFHNDGTVHWLRAKGRMFFDARGQPERMVGFMFDVTDWRHAEDELRASEARFRSFVDHATDAFFLLDEQLHVVDVNRQACENLGWSREELIGMYPLDFDAGLDERSLLSLAERARAGETITFETHHRRKDGTAFPVEIRTRMFGQGDRRFYLALARDITERKLAEETVRGKDHALQMARAELARVSRVTTLGELTASIAHEVNQPLGAMVANAAACTRWLAARPPEVRKARQALESISADGKRAGEIIGRIRALTKRQPPSRARLDVNRKILDVLEFAEAELRSREVAVETRLESDLPPVSGDRVQLQQVLLNLIVNAIDAMDAVHDRPRALTIVSKRDGPDCVAVEVRDSGTGLDPEAAERLFEAFYTTKPEGIGIGLSISRSIVEAHGGQISVSANAPHGAVFRFTLPLAEGESS